MKITEFFVRRPVLFWSLMAAILIAGLLSFIQMPKLEDPAVAVKQAMVMVPYPGASAHEVELKVAQMMEDELRALPNVKKVKSECRNGSAMLTVEFQMTVLNRDLEQHFDLLRRKVNDAASRLPEGCYDPVVIDDMMDVYGIFYALTADGYDYPEMYRYAKFLRRELLDVKGVKRILIAGNRDEVINIILSKEQIARNGVIPTQITSALQQAGKTVNAGAYPTGDERIALYVDSAVDDVEEIRNLEIRTMDGRQLRIGDVARVERGYAAPQRNGFFVDGRPALALCIAMESSAIVPDVGKAVDARLAEAMRQLPAGFQTEKIFFQPDKVSDAISSFMRNLLESVVIVILVLIFTMGFRSGLIIGFGLVLTVAVSFPILLVCGTTLQRISLGAFIVAMGMLVDNAVVIMDGILIDKKRGLSPKVYLYRIGRHAAARGDRYRRLDLSGHLSLTRFGGRVCRRPLSGAVRESAGQLGAGTRPGADLCQVVAPGPRKATSRSAETRRDEFAGSSLRAAHDLVPHRLQANDDCRSRGSADPLDLRHDTRQESLFPRLRLQTVRRRVLLPVGDECRPGA